MPDIPEANTKTERVWIVKEFYKNGFFLSPAALDFLAGKSEQEIRAAIDSIENQDRSVLGISDLMQRPKSAVRILKNLLEKPHEIKTEDFIQFYHDKYTKMQKIISERLKAEYTSLDKIDASRKDITTIVMVKDIRDNEDKQMLDVEDLTGRSTAIFSVPVRKVQIDDVVALKGIAAGKIIYGKDVVYPDMPLRSASEGIGQACFVSDMHLEQAPTTDVLKFFEWFSKSDVKVLFIAGDVVDMQAFEKMAEEYIPDKTIFIIPGNSDDNSYPALPLGIRNKRPGVFSLSNPAMVELGGLKILMIHSFNTEMLLKRYLGHSKSILHEDYLVLEELPDIVHCGHTHLPEIQNYKSTTIVNSGSFMDTFKPVIVDFGTRDVKQVNL